MYNSRKFKKTLSNYQNLGDSLSDTEIELRKSSNEFKCHETSLRFATGDGFEDSTKQQKQAFRKPMSIKDEMKIGLQKINVESDTSSRNSEIYKIYPIEEVSSERSSDCNRPQNVREILADNRVRAQNRPFSAKKNINLEKDFEIRKQFTPSEESALDSTFGDQLKLIENCKLKSSVSDSIASFKRIQIHQLSVDSVRVYQSRLKKINEGNDADDQQSLLTFDDSQSIHSTKKKNCLTCCFKKPFFKGIRKFKKK